MSVIPAEAGIHFKKHGCPPPNLGHDEKVPISKLICEPKAPIAFPPS